MAVLALLLIIGIPIGCTQYFKMNCLSYELNAYTNGNCLS